MSAADHIPAPPKWEGLIRALAPMHALRRQRARVQLGFEAAQLTRLRGHSQVLAGPESMRTANDRIGLMMQVRDLEQNDGLFRSIISKVATYAVGRLRYQAQTGKGESNRAYEAYLARRFKRCDISGEYNLRGLAAVTLQSVLRDGDFGWAFRSTKEGTMVQGIEADRIGGNIVTATLPGYTSGVTFDPLTGRRLSYKVFDRTLADSYTNPRDIPASDFRLFYKPWRYDQYRGWTEFGPVVNVGRDLKEVKEATLIGVKIESYSGGFITGGNGQLNDSDPATIMNSSQVGPNGTTLTEEKLQYGQFRYLANGTKVEFPKNSRPSGDWQAYVTTLVREIALALNLPFGFVYDLAILNGNGARMDAQQAHRVIESWQGVLVERGLDDYKNRCLVEGIAAGEIPYEPRWESGIWKFPPAISIDAGRDTASAINAVRAGMMTKADWFDENGQDSEEEADKIADEAKATVETAKRISEETGVPVDTVLNLLEIRLPNGSPQITVTDPKDDAAEPPLIAQIGVGGTSALASIVQQVADGKLPVASGRALLVSVFGLTPEQAAEALPDGIKVAPAPAASGAVSAEPTEAELSRLPVHQRIKARLDLDRRNEVRVRELLKGKPPRFGGPMIPDGSAQWQAN